MLEIIVLLQLAILVVVVYTALKARRIRREVHWGNQRARAASVETTQQLESLDWLYRRQRVLGRYQCYARDTVAPEKSSVEVDPVVPFTGTQDGGPLQIVGLDVVVGRLRPAHDL